MFLLVEFLNERLIRSIMYIKPMHWALFIWVKYFIIK